MSQDRLDQFLIAREQMDVAWEAQKDEAWSKAQKDPKLGMALRANKITKDQFAQMVPAVLTLPVARSILDSLISIEKWQLEHSQCAHPAEEATATPASSLASSKPKTESCLGESSQHSNEDQSQTSVTLNPFVPRKFPVPQSKTTGPSK